MVHAAPNFHVAIWCRGSSGTGGRCRQIRRRQQQQIPTTMSTAADSSHRSQQRAEILHHGPPWRMHCAQFFSSIHFIVPPGSSRSDRRSRSRSHSRSRSRSRERQSSRRSSSSGHRSHEKSRRDDAADEKSNVLGAVVASADSGAYRSVHSVSICCHEIRGFDPQNICHVSFTFTARASIRDASQTGRAGGVYVPPFKLKQMQEQMSQDSANPVWQRLQWEALRKSINGLVNKVCLLSYTHLLLPNVSILSVFSNFVDVPSRGMPRFVESADQHWQHHQSSSRVLC